MKRMKRVSKKAIISALIIILVAAAVLSACGSGSAEWPAMKELSALNASDITSIDYSRITEGGNVTGTIDDSTEIEDVYLRLKEVSIKGETEKAVEDDGLGLKVHAEDKDMDFTFEGDILVIEDGGRYEVENLSSLKSYINKLVEENTSDNESDTNESNNSQGSSDGYKDTTGARDYDVSKGFEKTEWQDKEILYFNDFMVTMPDNDKWSFEMDGNAVTFYLFSARQSGIGGRLVTIKAYDIDDKSYEQMPMPYQVAGVGKNVNKRFIAIYPSDVQYDFNDEQQTADYMELYDYLKKIAEGSANSPLQTSDSDSQ